MMFESLEQEKVKPAKGWSDIEKWAWEKICAGQIADFNVLYGKGEHEPDPTGRIANLIRLYGRDEHDTDPTGPQGWHDGRRLGAGFLREILFREPYRSAIQVEGVRIVGALFPE